jgi:hypothetical protein
LSDELLSRESLYVVMDAAPAKKRGLYKKGPIAVWERRTMASLVDYEPFLNKPREPWSGAWKIFDALSWGLPIGAAILSVLGGLVAIFAANSIVVPILGIAAGGVGAITVPFAIYMSRIRDWKLRFASSVAWMAVETADMTASQISN